MHSSFNNGLYGTHEVGTVHLLLVSLDRFDGVSRHVGAHCDVLQACIHNGGGATARSDGVGAEPSPVPWVFWSARHPIGGDSNPCQ